MKYIYFEKDFPPGDVEWTWMGELASSNEQEA